LTGITTHVLDLTTGRPVAGLAVRLACRQPDGAWRHLAAAETDTDGRIRSWDAADGGPGDYRLEFRTAEHFAAAGVDAFHPEVCVAFRVADPAQQHHVPLLLSPFGYTTYRGS
jgi:5-hydroxyisourate hydrolase